MRYLPENRLIEIMTNSDNFYRPEIVSMATEILSLREQYNELARGVEESARVMSEILSQIRAAK